ncbi:ABC-F family ATP-binding cassette domain-containing protein [bacterium]|nr:MAG: ABC-F family ATP-binding cassette domain-containing protein [bacterium]
MNLLSTENISKSFGIKTLFKDLSFGIEEGQKTALIALNGAGKTTLLNMLTGKDAPDTGMIILRNQLTVGYLEQNPKFNESATVLESIFQADHPKLRVISAYEAAMEESELSSTEQNQKNLADAMESMEHLKLWDYEYKIKEILSHLKITNLHQTVETLSGGQRKRVALARVLVEEPGLLILDEPTNHLDLDMIEWLEDYLSRPNLTLFLVTHDRYLLDNVCDEILELDQGELFRYTGDYSYFLEKKAEREDISGRELDHLRNRLRHELEWIKRQPKARTTKSKSRVEAFYGLQEKAAGNAPEEKLKLDMRMKRVGGKILELKKIHKTYGNLTILNGFDYTFKKGERIGIVGSNGTGKSTFLNIITGLETTDSGKIDIGETIQFGYYSQQGLLVNEDKRVIDIVREFAEVITIGAGEKLTASQFLNLFQFPPASQHTPVSKLSGGEKRRLYLLTVLIKNPNFLILDEPTNDLDLTTLNILEEFLMNFKGCLLVVSHDRYFMNRLVDHLFVFEGNGFIKDFNGNYAEYRESQKTDTPKETVVIKQKKDEGAPKTKLSYKERQEFQKLEVAIAELELEKDRLTKLLETGGSDYQELQKHSLRLAEVTQLLDEKSTRWLELSEFA